MVLSRCESATSANEPISLPNLLMLKTFTNTIAVAMVINIALRFKVKIKSFIPASCYLLIIRSNARVIREVSKTNGQMNLDENVPSKKIIIPTIFLTFKLVWPVVTLVLVVNNREYYLHSGGKNFEATVDSLQLHVIPESVVVGT